MPRLCVEQTDRLNQGAGAGVRMHACSTRPVLIPRIYSLLPCPLSVGAALAAYLAGWSWVRNLTKTTGIFKAHGRRSSGGEDGAHSRASAGYHHCTCCARLPCHAPADTVTVLPPKAYVWPVLCGRATLSWRDQLYGVLPHIHINFYWFSINIKSATINIYGSEGVHLILRRARLAVHGSIE